MGRWLPMIWVCLSCWICLACAETPDDPPDQMLDMTVVDARIARPAGSPCTDQADCIGVCWTDGLGRRCVPACDDCPTGLSCQTQEEISGCLPTQQQAGLGDACGIDRPCAPDLQCVADLNPEQTICAQPCSADSDCNAPEICAPTGICAPPDATVLQCPFVECARADLLCIDNRCLAACPDLGLPCGDGGVCTRDDESGAQLCVPDATGALGSGCTSGGAAACDPELICLTRAPGDPAAVCSRPCADDCSDGFACRRPPGFEAPHCLPAPFGLGDGSGGLFADCSQHGATDCAPDLDCVLGLAGRPHCAPPCSAGCAADAECDDAGLTPHCRPITRDRIGLPCVENDACPAGRCVPESPPFCTAACAPDCPVGFVCVGDECLPGSDESRPLGAECADGGATACADDICAAHPDTGLAVCTRSCAEADCPANFECRALDANQLCFVGVD